MADYTSLGSFSTGGAASLNGELVQKLYDAEATTRVEPLEKSIELIETETTVISDVNTKINELIASVKAFDLYSSGNNAFEQISATTTGESAIFDAADVGALKEGTININIATLASKDAYQTDKFSSKSDIIGNGTLSINGTDFITDGKTYDELLSDINSSGTIDASIEQVSDTEYRLIIKSQEPGIANALTIAQSGGLDLGLLDETVPGTLDNQVLIAKNLTATIDGVAYDVSSNSVTIDGNLKMTASTTGDSSISIQKDDSQIIPAIQNVVDKYNELLLMVTEEIYSATPSVQDTSTLKSIVDNIKNTMFDTFGVNDDSMLTHGFSFDKTGTLSLDSTVLGKALTDDPDKVKALFIGVAEDKGFGTTLKEQLDDLNAYNGLFSTMEDSIAQRKIDLEKEKEDAVKALDTKYDTMAAQFAAYGSVISQMEASFGGLKAIIASENSSN